LASRPTPSRLRPLQAADALQHLVQHVTHQVKDAQLVQGIRPNLSQQLRVEVGTVTDHDLGFEPPVGQVTQEAAHVFLVVGPDQGETNRQVGQRVGGQQQGVSAQVQLIDAQGAGETLEYQLAVGRQV